MSRILFHTEDGKTIVADPDFDVCLYEAPNNPPNTGTKYSRGIDYYAHKTRSGNWIFYVYSWSIWQGETSKYMLIDGNEAKHDLQEKVGGEWGLSNREMKMCLEIWADFMEETA